MKRRAFLKKMIGTGVAAGAAMFQSPFNRYFREARAAPNLPALVVIFQRGGCDGLNTVVPYGDPFYYGLRPTIAIKPPNQNDPASAIDLDGYFGLHPSLAELSSIFDAGDMAILPTVQYPGYSRSHFDSQHFIESAIREDDYDGWLNRYLASSVSASQVRAVHFGGSLAHALRGEVPVASFSSINSFNLGLGGAEEDVLIDHVLPVYDQAPNPNTAYRRLVQDFGQVLFNSLDVAGSIDTSSYDPVIGGNVNGGIYNGLNGWPGLADNQMISGRFLQYTTDYRDIMGDIIAGHLGNNALNVVLPQHTHTPVGLYPVSSPT